ncbi:MAG: hypothetical protein AAGB51_13695 [Planctomycetota bacterium]
MKRVLKTAAPLACAGVVFSGTSAQAQSLFATTVVEYTPGSNPASGFTDPTAALGSPTRFGVGGAITPFNSSFGSDETVSIGEGGSLTLGFDQTVLDDPNNPFGIDLLVFGNSFFGLDFGSGLATGAIFSEGGTIELSENGVDWFEVVGVEADGLFPTLGYQDVTEPFPSTAGSVLTDFHTPVDPNLDVTGMTIVEIAAAYNGSGGGAGIDIGSTGLSAVNFIRFSNAIGSGVTPEIDAVSIVVPAPMSVLALTPLARRRRRR